MRGEADGWWCRACERLWSASELRMAVQTPFPFGVYLLEPPIFLAGEDFNGVAWGLGGAWLGRVSWDSLADGESFAWLTDEEDDEIPAPPGWEKRVARRMQPALEDVSDAG